MPTAVDPRYFQIGNAFLGGMEQAQEGQRRNAMLDLEQRQQQFRESAFDAQSQQADSARASRVMALQEIGLSPEVADALADDPDAPQLIMEHRQMQQPKPPGQLYQVAGPQGPVFQPADQAAGQPAYVKPERSGSNDPPSGFRWKAGGSLEPIPGGPNDPTGPNQRRGSQPLRKEFRGLPSIKSYEEVLPLVQSAKNAPDTGYGDLQLIYTVGKALDPGSVVREGELALTIAAGSPLQRIIGATRFTAEKGGRLPPQSRQQIMQMLGERVNAYKQAYDRDFNQYGEYASEQGYDPALIVGQHADSAYQKKPGKAKAKDSGWSIELIQE
jgi:hypothetical protein